MKKFKLNNQTQMPILGFGTWHLTGQQAVESVTTALEIGYRHIDTADYYSNHEEVGQAIKDSPVDREEIFLVTKLWPRDLASKPVKEITKRFLDELNTDYIDLLLIHWPRETFSSKDVLYQMGEIKEKGIIKAIGVSNYGVSELKEALKTDVEVTNNQIEYHPQNQPKKLIQFCRDNDVTVTAYSPLDQAKALDLPIIKKLSKKYSKPPAQVIINWLRQQDVIVIPKATSRDHIEQNFNSFDWELEKKDIEKINRI